MSGTWLDLPGGSRHKIYVNNVEQPDVDQLEFSGTGLSVHHDPDRNTVRIEGSGGNTSAPYILATPDISLPYSCVLEGSTSVQVVQTAGKVTLSCVFGTTAGTSCVGNDSRLSDARSPTAHTASHKHGGSDEIATATAAANAIPKAGSGGTLAVNWLPTGTSGATVCIGNDVRVPASNPSAATTGQSVVSNGARVVYRGDVGRWWNSGITPGSTANGVDNLAVTNAPASLRNGHPIRILDSTGMVTNNAGTPTAPNLAGTDQSITGLRGSILDYRGCLWFKVVVVSGSQCRMDLYNDEWCDAANLVGHTGQFDAASNTTSTLTVTADNGSGLGGTFPIYTRGCSAVETVHCVQYFKTGIVSSVDNANGELFFCGQALSLTTGAIKELWFGAPELVVPMHVQINGPYAPETTDTALLNRNADVVKWWQGPATIVQAFATHLSNDSGATQPKVILMIGGLAIISDTSAQAMVLNPLVTNIVEGATATRLRVEAGTPIELRTVAGTNLDAQNAIIDILGVLD